MSGLSCVPTFENKLHRNFDNKLNGCLIMQAWFNNPSMVFKVSFSSSDLNN